MRDLDKGTFGFVQLAKDTMTEELVAVKFIERHQEVTGIRLLHIERFHKIFEVVEQKKTTSC